MRQDFFPDALSAFGATDGVRTRDLRLGKPPLCQLSYYRTSYVNSDL